MKNSDKDKLADKPGFNLLVGCIVALGIAAIVYGVFDQRYGMPLLTSGLIAIVVATFLALFRLGRK